jgi:hypothetical protein
MNCRRFVFALASVILASNTALSQTCGNPAGTAGKVRRPSSSGAYQTFRWKQTFQTNRLPEGDKGLAPWLVSTGLVVHLG